MDMIVMSYEAKHNFAKRLAHVIRNFKNIAYSVSECHQMAHALNWMTLSLLKGCAEVGSGEMAAVADLQDCVLLIPYTGSGIDVFAANSVAMFGQEYLPRENVAPLVDRWPHQVCSRLVFWACEEGLLTHCSVTCSGAVCLCQC